MKLLYIDVGTSFVVFDNGLIISINKDSSLLFRRHSDAYD